MSTPWVYSSVGNLDTIIRTMDSLFYGRWWTKRRFSNIAEIRALWRSPELCPCGLCGLSTLMPPNHLSTLAALNRLGTSPLRGGLRNCFPDDNNFFRLVRD